MTVILLSPLNCHAHGVYSQFGVPTMYCLFSVGATVISLARWFTSTPRFTESRLLDPVFSTLCEISAVTNYRLIG